MTKILTVETHPYDLDMVPEEIEDIRYCVLDYIIQGSGLYFKIFYF